MSDTNSVPENLDAVLRKYGKIWIWSILSAAVAALSVRVLNNSSILTFQGITGAMAGMGGMRNPWTPLVMLWAFVPSLGTLAAVYFLLQFLRYHILPILFPPSAVPAVEAAQDFTLTGAPAGTSDPSPVAEAVPDGGQLLLNAFAAIVIGMLLEALGVIGSIVYRALNNF